MTNESWIPAPSRRTPMATSENLNKIVDCDHCDREHWAPPPPPPFYSSFAIPLMRNHIDVNYNNGFVTTTNGEE